MEGMLVLFSSLFFSFFVFCDTDTISSPPTEECDIVAESLPWPIQLALSVHLTKRIAEAEKSTIDGLRNAGFELDFGQDGAGIARAYFTRGGGYYIDVGCSQLIIDGKIKVKHNPGGITGFEHNKLELADGDSLPADIVVLATGYDNMRTTVRKVLGDKVADRCSDVWDLDNEGEVQAVSSISCNIVTSSGIVLIFFLRCGAPAATQASGTLAEILHCVASTLGSWLSRSKQLSLGFLKGCDSENLSTLNENIDVNSLPISPIYHGLSGDWRRKMIGPQISISSSINVSIARPPQSPTRNTHK